MITIPVYDLLVLPGVSFYFKKDMFPARKITPEDIGENVLFLVLKEEKDRKDLVPEDFYPIGVSAKIESIDEEGTVRVTAKTRVSLSDIEVTEESITAEASILPDIDDLDEEEEKEHFARIREELLDFTKNFNWGMWARAMILRWKNFDEVACALAGYLSIPWEEKYELMEENSRKARMEKIERAVYELIAVYQVGEEAETAQKDSNSQLYRESALKKQIEFLQKQLDEMHPENISDVRRFETKIAESGMNEEAKREAEKVLNRMKQEGKDGHEYGMLYDYLDFVTSLSCRPDFRWYLVTDRRPAHPDQQEKLYQGRLSRKRPECRQGLKMSRPDVRYCLLEYLHQIRCQNFLCFAPHLRWHAHQSVPKQRQSFQRRWNLHLNQWQTVPGSEGQSCQWQDCRSAKMHRT